MRLFPRSEVGGKGARIKENGAKGRNQRAEGRRLEGKKVKKV